jgi:DNA-directed RNA polymerase subunit M/transcription elongation factor TFIIS
LTLVVPAESRKAVRGEEYALAEGDRPSAWQLQPHVSVACPVCRTVLVAPEDQAGQKIACPDCGTQVTVPERKPTAPAGKPAAPPTEIYAVCDDAAPPPKSAAGAERRVPEPVYFPVYCGLCRTLMHATEEQVGDKLVCPDCGTTTVVRRPNRPEPRLTPADFRVKPNEEFDVCDGVDQPAAGSKTYRTYIPVECPLCRTRLLATEDQVGAQIVCPDCGTSAVVPAARPAGAPRFAPAPSAGGYHVDRSFERPEVRVGIDYRTGLPADEGTVMERLASLPKPPRWPLLAGVFTFPFSADVYSRWLLLGAALLPGWCVLGFAYQLASAPPMGAASAIPWIAAMLLTVVGLMVLLLWGVGMSANFVAVVVDTSRGLDRVEDRSSGTLADWLGDFLYIAVAVFLGAAPGIIAARAGGAAGVPDAIRWLFAPASLWVFFPLLLLAMMEAGSPLAVLSPAIARSTIRSWHWWAMFYVETLMLPAVSAALLAAGALASVAAIHTANWLGIGDLAVFAAAIALAALAAIVLVFDLFVYARLLGRLAWLCAWSAAHAETA